MSFVEVSVNEPDSTVDCSVRGSTLVATILIKELRDNEAIQRLKDELLAAITLAKPRNVVIDLSHVHFVGSVGFLVFLRARREPDIGRIVLCGLIENVRGAFALCRLIPDAAHTLAPFDVAESTNEALFKCGETV
jgi:anti-anti-sigma factor